MNTGYFVFAKFMVEKNKAWGKMIFVFAAGA